jgi:hypothetical protein
MKKHQFDLQDEQDAIQSAIRRIASCLGKTPTQHEYKTKRNPNEPSLEQITYRLGTWSAAVQKAGLEPNPSQQPPRQPEITKQQLVDEFIRVANELGRISGTHQFRAKSCYSWTPYKTNWGSWRQAVDFIIGEYGHRFCFEVKTSKQKKATTPRKRLSISCPLLFEPQNEYETIALFCLLAEELGFAIKSIRSDFPDGLLEQNGTDVPVEFEFLSSNYRQHCHPANFNGTVICWRKDDDLDGIKIISLEEYLKHKKA